MNWVLIIITAIVGLLAIGVSLYLLVAYQHPEDKNQAWFPKIIVILGMSIAIWTVLLFPLDVANVQSCDLSIPWSSCDTTFPMNDLWYAAYIGNMVVTFVLVPFALFYYEADSEWCVWEWCSATTSRRAAAAFSSLPGQSGPVPTGMQGLWQAAVQWLSMGTRHTACPGAGHGGSIWWVPVQFRCSQWSVSCCFLFLPMCITLLTSICLACAPMQPPAAT